MVNYFKIMEHVEETYSSGNFLILESDVIPLLNWESTFDAVTRQMNHISFDFVHIGNGCNLSPTMFGHNIRGNAVKLYRCPKARCTEAIVWSFDGIKKFNSHRKGMQIIDQPLDFHFDDIISALDGNIFWSYPSIFAQGSQNGLYKSAIQYDKNPRDT
jgi:hypothetical protein